MELQTQRTRTPRIVNLISDLLNYFLALFFLHRGLGLKQSSRLFLRRCRLSGFFNRLQVTVIYRLLILRGAGACLLLAGELLGTYGGLVLFVPLFVCMLAPLRLGLPLARLGPLFGLSASL